jgi:Protein of unknown function (DUF3050)
VKRAILEIGQFIETCRLFCNKLTNGFRAGFIGSNLADLKTKPNSSRSWDDGCCHCPGVSARVARLINDIVIGEETDVDPDGSYISHLDLYLRAMAGVDASTRQFDTFRSLARVGTVRSGVPPHVQAFVVRWRWPSRGRRRRS